MLRRILLVEDNASDEKLTIAAFKRSGVVDEINVVRDGVAALDALLGRSGEARVDLPRVVLLDLKLPKLGGLEVLRRLRAEPRTKTLPVVVLTASKEEDDVLAGFELGASAYVRKPVEFSEFVESAKTIAVFWLTLNEPPPRGHPGE